MTRISTYIYIYICIRVHPFLPGSLCFQCVKVRNIKDSLVAPGNPAERMDPPADFIEFPCAASGIEGGGWLFLERRNPDSHRNPLYKAFYRVRFCGNEAIGR